MTLTHNAKRLAVCSIFFEIQGSWHQCRSNHDVTVAVACLSRLPRRRRVLVFALQNVHLLSRAEAASDAAAMPSAAAVDAGVVDSRQIGPARGRPGEGTAAQSRRANSLPRHMLRAQRRICSLICTIAISSWCGNERGHGASIVAAVGWSPDMAEPPTPTPVKSGWWRRGCSQDGDDGSSSPGFHAPSSPESDNYGGSAGDGDKPRDGGYHGLDDGSLDVRMHCGSQAQGGVGQGMHYGEGTQMRAMSPGAQYWLPRVPPATARQLPFTPSSIPVGECGSDYASRRGYGGWDGTSRLGSGGHGGGGRWEEGEGERGRPWHRDEVRLGGAQADDPRGTQSVSGLQRDAVLRARSLSRERERGVSGRENMVSNSGAHDLSPARGFRDRPGADVGSARRGYRERRDLSPPRSLSKGGR